MKVHVHVYRVIEKAEVTVTDVEDQHKAEDDALTIAKSGGMKFGESDCSLLALSWKWNEDKGTWER